MAGRRPYACRPSASARPWTPYQPSRRCSAMPTSGPPRCNAHVSSAQVEEAVRTPTSNDRYFSGSVTCPSHPPLRRGFRVPRPRTDFQFKFSLLTTGPTADSVEPLWSPDELRTDCGPTIPSRAFATRSVAASATRTSLKRGSSAVGPQGAQRNGWAGCLAFHSPTVSSTSACFGQTAQPMSGATSPMAIPLRASGTFGPEVIAPTSP